VPVELVPETKGKRYNPIYMYQSIVPYFEASGKVTKVLPSKARLYSKPCVAQSVAIPLQPHKSASWWIWGYTVLPDPGNEG
jgi:hypothetical protein